MNFRPTKLKVIFGILFSVVVWIVVFFTFKDLTSKLPGFLVNYANMYNFIFFFSKDNIILFLIQFLIFYLVFSLFQIKKLKVN